MIRKMLLKFITQFYESAVKLRTDTDVKELHMPDIVIDAFNKKYGMPKVIETKYTQLLSSCIKYKSIKRIYIFGRFLKLYDELSDEDLVVYADGLAFMKTGNYKEPQLEHAESYHIPYDKAVEYHKIHLTGKLNNEENEALKKAIEKLRQGDKQTSIEFDHYFEEIIDRIKEKREVRMNFVKCIYEAADLNGDGFLEYTEFQMLVRHISEFKISNEYSLDLFSKFAENFTDEQEEEVKALSFENFSHLTLTYQVFTIESLNKFAKLYNEKGSIGHLEELALKIDDKLTEFKWRFSLKQDWEDHVEEYEKILHNLGQKVRNPTLPDSVWVGYRLMDEESKLICLTNTIRSLLPKIGVILPN